MKNILLAVLLVGCAETVTPYVAPVPDAGVTPDAVMPEADAAPAPDTMPAADAGVPHDAGTTPDTGTVPDAGNQPDAGSDSGIRPDASAPDGADSGTEPTPDSGVDAGVDADHPVGSPTQLTGSRCALDSLGDFWCWDRWEPSTMVRRLGGPFDTAAGTCAMRRDTVWCADFETISMIQITEGGRPIHLLEIAEWSDFQQGCGTRHSAIGNEAVCWENGGRRTWQEVDSDTYVGVALSAEGAADERIVMPYLEPFLYVDVNPPAACYAQASVVDCHSYYHTDTRNIAPAGDYYSLGFSMGCSYTDHEVRCQTTRSSVPWVFSAEGTPTDVAVTWPIGDYTTDTWIARGVCVASTAGIACHGVHNTVNYTVDW